MSSTDNLTAAPLAAVGLVAGYGGAPVLDGIDLSILEGGITAVIGPNGSGKSTLLSALARLIPARQGAVLLDGADIGSLPTRQVARRLGMLPQSPAAPEGITVAELVRRGRHPHRRFGARTAHDDLIVAQAMMRTGVVNLATRPIDTLSGGQRQRAWIAMALAQQTGLLLLDEPTSSLDIAHQIDVLDLLVDLAADGTTVVIVLHDLGLAARYADTVIALSGGEIAAVGTPHDVITEETLQAVFAVDCRIIADPDTGTPLILPRGRHVPFPTSVAIATH